MDKLIAWFILVSFSIALVSLLAYAFGDKYYTIDGGKVKEKSLIKIMINGLLNVFCVCLFLLACIGFIAGFLNLVHWAIITVSGA